MPKFGPTPQESSIQSTGQPAETHDGEGTGTRMAEMPISDVGSQPWCGPALKRHRCVSIGDARFPSGRVYVVAWDVVSQGNSDLSTMLCRSTGGDYFLRGRSGDQPDVADSIIPLSAVEASVWFDQHPVHFAPRDARWH